MQKIKANVKYIERVKFPCPQDKVHVCGKDGAIKGVHALYFDEKLIFKGSNAFFWPINEEWGLKVYYSFGWFGAAKKKFVKLEYDNMRKLHKIGLAPEVKEVQKVKLDLKYKDKHIEKSALAVLTKRIIYPEDAWENYATGYPYNWYCIEGDWHTAEGFLKFRDAACESIRKHKIKFLASLKLGDIMPDVNLGRWFIVDAGR